MESQDKEKEYENTVWEIYRKEWATASPEKKTELNKRMLRWQELMRNGLTASEAYYRVMEGELGEIPQLIPAEKKATTKTRRYLLGALALVLILSASLVIYAQISTPASESSVEPAPEAAPVSVQQPEPPSATVANPRYIYEDGAIHIGGDGEPIELVNNPDATNPTYAELVAFIKEDTSDSKVYFEGFERQGKIIWARVCADFAEDVHNNAEAKGIKAAWVSIDLRANDDGHALNAFETTDKGLVYVDCTGEDTLGSQLMRQINSTDAPSSWDKIAYVEVGKVYGAIYIDNAKSPSYDFYEAYKQKWQECERMLREYNEEVVQYNREIAGKVYYEGSSALARMEVWEARLEEQSQLIDELIEELGDFCPEPLGIVEDIHIHW